MRDVATPFSLVVESNENALFLTCKFAPNTSLDDLRKLYLDYQKKNNSEVLVKESPPLEETLDFGHGPREEQDEISSASNIILAPNSLSQENPIVDPATNASTSAAVPGEDPNDPIEASQPKKKKRRTSGRRRQVINW